VIPEIKYAPNGDLSIAYMTLGEGPVDVVFIPGFVSNIEKYWDLPFIAHDLRRLAQGCRLQVFDKRGTGLSDRHLGAGSIEERMDDVRAVLDHAGVERAAILGLSEGGPMAMTFAATFPDRVTALALWGTFSRSRPGDDYPYGRPEEEVQHFFAMIREAWGTGTALAPAFIQGLPDDEQTRQHIASFERAATTPALAEALMRLNYAIDCRSALPAISAPTLVLHRRGDPMVPVEHGRYLAEHIPGARLLELPGETHVSGVVGSDDDVIDAANEFFTGLEHHGTSEADRMLATVLFTDIVDSTRQAAAQGDARWRQLLEEHDRLAAQEVERQRGRVVKTTGDGLLATFDGPARGVRAAQAIVDRSHLLQLQVRAGLHTGEVELRGEDVAGMAVHIGARIGALAGPDEVLVSRTVTDLVVGSGLEFEDRGTHELKGVPGEWPVFAVVA
jgi:class 3 adenylate cyclase/alpha-beta hydrolase superfamily lysophospholipase